MSKDEAALESEIQAKGKTALRVTPERIDKLISAEHIINVGEALRALGHPVIDEFDLMTVCFLHLENGFIVTGESACVSPENYDADIGRKVARDNARSKIWALEGYALKSRLAADLERGVEGPHQT